MNLKGRSWRKERTGENEEANKKMTEDGYKKMRRKMREKMKLTF